jgi:hypothetical protein
MRVLIDRRSALLALVLSGFIAANARAECDCAEVSNKESFKCHRAVFVGSVLDAGPAARIAVKEIFKGRLPAEVFVDSSGECRLFFEPGRSYLIEVFDDDRDRSVLRTSICSHTRPLDDIATANRVAELRRRAWWWRLPLSGWCRHR